MRRAVRAGVIALFLTPFLLVLMATGTIFLWENSWLWKWIWIPVPFCWGIGYLMLRWTKRHFGALWQPRIVPLIHWTETDKTAWQKVVAFADQSTRESASQFFEPVWYVETTRQLALRVAAHYHPQARDAIESLTVPEVLTAAELAISDLRRFVEQNIPGSHLMTMGWLARAPQVTDMWNRIRPIYYTASLLWHPWNVLSRAAAEQAVVSPVMDQLKKEGMLSLHRAFVLQTGMYLIELNSHRLRMGPDRWRELRGEQVRPPSARATKQTEADPQREPPAPLQIVVAGQVKAGKSSLINALVGHQQAAVDLLPLTDSISRYTLQPPGTATPLVLLDTVGYAHEGLRADRVDETMRAVCASAMTLLVVNAVDPARQSDLLFLTAMQDWFTAHPQRQRPPILVVVTHIDRLAPSLEWTPPYDGWVQLHPQRLKERNIQDAVRAIQQLFQHRVQGVVPACTDVARNRQYGVDQWVVPALLNLLPQATAKHLLDALYDQRDQSQFTRLLSQTWHAASLLARYQFCGPDTLMPTPQLPTEAPPNT